LLRRPSVPSEKAFAQAQTELEQIIKPPKIDQAAPMLLQADEMIYDNENARITAKGNVEIYYGNYTLLADSVVYDRGNNTLTAVGNVRIKDPDGAVITSDHITLDRRFPRRLHRRVEARHQGRHAHPAQSASRQAGDVTVFENALFTPCKICEEDPTRPPTWRIRAKKITHKARSSHHHLQQRVLRFLRRAGNLGAMVPERRSDGEAEVRLPNAVLQPFQRARHDSSGTLLLRAL
jgi:LPS-assembly protein